MFTPSIATSFKAQILAGEHDMDTDTIKLALYNSTSSIGAATTVYTATNEVTGSGYTAGGITLTGGTIWTDGTTVGFSFDNPTTGVMTVSGIRSALFYNSSKSNKAVGVIGFGSDITCTAQSLQIVLPVSSTTTGLFKFL